MRVRSAADSAAKFKARAAAAQNDYANGVRGAGGRWADGAMASEDVWAAGTQEAIAQKRFGKGVRKAGAAKYEQNAVTLGPSRFATGVANAEPAYAAGVAPFVQAMSSATLPPKGARGSAQNMARVQAQADLMRKIRMERLGA
jgi:hypothetical protein